MKGERRLLRTGEYLIARACRHLPAGARDERYREWVAELPAILQDPDVRPAARRAAPPACCATRPEPSGERP